jgi:hypothetical protein
MVDPWRTARYTKNVVLQTQAGRMDTAAAAHMPYSRLLGGTLPCANTPRGPRA